MIVAGSHRALDAKGVLNRGLDFDLWSESGYEPV